MVMLLPWLHCCDNQQNIENGKHFYNHGKRKYVTLENLVNQKLKMKKSLRNKF